MKIADRDIGAGHPTFVVAELSGNHQGSYEKAMLLIDAAAQSGADAVKFQLYRPDDLTSRRHTQVLGSGPWAGQTLWDLYDHAKTPLDWFPDLFKAARERGLIPFASVFAPWGVDFLEGLACPAYKIASLEIGETGLIRHAAATGKPLIISTGRATDGVIRNAVLAAQECALLHCLAAYPAPFDAMNLRTIPELRALGNCEVGLSDHSRQPLVAELAVAMGATIIEAHLMLPLVASELPPLDAEHSLQPVEFQEMVEGVRIAERALGTVIIGPRAAEQQTDPFVRRWHYAQSLPAGTRLEGGHFKSLRGPDGLETVFMPPIGEQLRVDVDEDDPVEPDDRVPA